MWSLQNSPPTSSRLSFYLTLVWGFGNLYVAMVLLNVWNNSDCGLAAKPPQFASLSCFKLFFFPSSLLFIMSNMILANAESTTSFPCKQKKNRTCQSGRGRFSFSLTKLQCCPWRICLRKQRWVDLCVTAHDLISSCSNWHFRQLFTFLSPASF